MENPFPLTWNSIVAAIFIEIYPISACEVCTTSGLIRSNEAHESHIERHVEMVFPFLLLLRSFFCFLLILFMLVLCYFEFCETPGKYIQNVTEGFESFKFSALRLTQVKFQFLTKRAHAWIGQWALNHLPNNPTPITTNSLT